VAPPSPLGLLESKTWEVVPAMSLGLKDLLVKSLRTNDLTYQRALKIGLGQLRGPSWWTDTPRNCPKQISIVMVAHDGSYVNGFRSRMMKGKANCAISPPPTLRKKREGWGTPCVVVPEEGWASPLYGDRGYDGLGGLSAGG
jgi:hypothetical protein